MGAGPSSRSHGNDNDDDDDDAKCGFSLFGWNPAVGQRRSHSHHALTDIGSPLPDTPQFQRRRRKEVQNILKQEQQQQYNSQLGAGLEPEVLLPPQWHSKKSNDDIGLYEGPDSERLLHAKYDLQQALGVGSTSTVHRCVVKATGEARACKVIDCVLMEEQFAGMMTQFLTEIEALQKLKQHPGIIALYDVYIVTNVKIYIVMELMEGGELFDYVVQKGTLTEDEAAHIVRMVTSALVYMHDHNIVHRDLKPENLLLKYKPQASSKLVVKIIDFGLSKAMVEPMARTFLGTRGYLAPEMLQRRDYTKAVDTWALGIIVFVLVCGCLPFGDDSSLVPRDESVLQAKFVLRFPRWAKNLSASARDLLSHLLDIHPDRRYTAAQALRHPWVEGRTAVKGNMLASPKRISQSPYLGGSKTKKQAPSPPAETHIMRNSSL